MLLARLAQAAESGCDLAMADGTNAATSLPVVMADLAPHFRSLLAESLKAKIDEALAKVET